MRFIPLLQLFFFLATTLYRVNDDLAYPAVPRSMAKNRFEETKRFLHLIDNDCLLQGDKMAKIRSMQENVNASLQQFGVFPEDLLVDEQIVPYVGRHSRKIFIRG